MSSPALITSEPEVVIGPDGLPRLSQAYLDAYERFMQTLVTEDDRPVDSVFSAVQARLLVDALYASWKHPSADCGPAGGSLCPSKANL